MAVCVWIFEKKGINYYCGKAGFMGDLVKRLFHEEKGIMVRRGCLFLYIRGYHSLERNRGSFLWK